MGTFTPLVFGTNGEMGVDCQNVPRNLAEKISRKDYETYASVITWLHIQLSSAIVRTTRKCVKGTRFHFQPHEVSEHFTLASNVAGLFYY